MFSFLRRLARRKPAAPVPQESWDAVLAGVALFEDLDPEETGRLHQLAGQFFHDKVFEPAGDMVLDDAIRIRIAALAALPILGLDYGWYEGWQTVIVYPGQFIRPRSQFDDIGVMHEWEEALTGEAWERGPLILSWADVEASGRRDGYNVVIHEMAHKLDMLNGVPDGFPPLHRGLSRRAWTEHFTAAYQDFNARLDRGEYTAIDPYAAEEPGEFFAVLSEYFFELPELVKAEYPAIYELLAGFYRQDPAARLAARKSRQGLDHSTG